MKPSLTLVIAVYNAVKYLEFIFEALKRQSFKEFEVIVADDGSGSDIRELIERVRSSVDFPIQHLWHEDNGFRKNIMLNNAIRASQSDNLVFIDGDCVPHRDFLFDHWTNRQENGLLCGKRVNLSKQLTEQLTLEDIQTGKFERLSWRLFCDGLFARSINTEESLRITSPVLRKILVRPEGRILGCNFSVRKELLEKINGFNEDYRAPGRGEDSDIAFRLGLLGVRMVSIRFLAVQIHLYHNRTEGKDENKYLYEHILATREMICKHGLKNLD
ncbi:MAG: glycosyltransferase [Ignavibacteriales bacterium]|nr:glycosyltransferase [Ignavibacteriales bacterium]